MPSNVVTTPTALTEAQNVGEVHDTRYWPPVAPDGAGPTAGDTVHVDPSKRVACWPARAAQNVDDVQDTLSRVLPGVTGWSFDHSLPFHPMALPYSSTALQNELDGHETP